MRPIAPIAQAYSTTAAILPAMMPMSEAGLASSVSRVCRSRSPVTASTIRVDAVPMAMRPIGKTAAARPNP
jgi:hypothetical protein